MADGHLGKCKECTKSDSKKRTDIKSNDLEWVESELARHRKKSKKYRDMGKLASKEAIARGKKSWDERNKEKNRAHLKVSRAIKNGELTRQPCEVCGEEKSEAHHEDYSRPLYVVWLCKKHHFERHVELNRIERLTNFEMRKTEKLSRSRI